MFGAEEGALASYAKIDKLYRRMCFDTLAEHGTFTPGEVLVLMFLSNEDNAPLDTATDIAEFRNVSKGVIARAVESLTQQGLLAQARDTRDRRVVHLRLTQACVPICRCLAQCRARFTRELRRGLGPDDLAAARRISHTMQENIDRMLKGTNDE